MLGVPFSIISNRGTKIISMFWRKLYDDLGTKLTYSTFFYSQTDVQSECTIQVLEDMLRACLLDFCGHWDMFLSLCSSLIIIVTTQTLIWNHLRYYMIGDVDHPYDGSRLEIHCG